MKMFALSAGLALVTSVGVFSLANGCGSGAPIFDTPICASNQTKDCTCDDPTKTGSRGCLSDGSGYSSKCTNCVAAIVPEIKKTCGDSDCKPTGGCTVAPACTNNLKNGNLNDSYPTYAALNLGSFSSNDNSDNNFGNGAAGAPAIVGDSAGSGGAVAVKSTEICTAPKLRISLEGITANKRPELMYCTITVVGESEPEKHVLKAQDLSATNGKTITLNPQSAIIWGSTNGLTAAGTTLKLNYSCGEIKNTEAAKSSEGFLGAVGKVLQLTATAVPITCGGLQTLCSIGTGLATETITNVLSTDKDGKVVPNQVGINQSITLAQQIDLAKGGSWTVPAKSNNEDFDLDFRVRAWGCSDNGSLRP